MSDSSTPSVGPDCRLVHMQTACSEGDLSGPQVGAPSLSTFIMVALCAQQEYPPILLYHWRGLTGIGLVLVHPNITIYIMEDFIIGMGGKPWLFIGKMP